ncbi:MAG: hypothetical protein F6J93_06645 [Oscillatoria sp. SIO1A7]|nr:hypothetical protein [Oscillatoria sp. SIO1A7]
MENYWDRRDARPTVGMNFVWGTSAIAPISKLRDRQFLGCGFGKLLGQAGRPSYGRNEFCLGDKRDRTHIEAARSPIP